MALTKPENTQRPATTISTTSGFSRPTWAHGNGIPARRVKEVLELVGLSQVGGRRAGGFSLGMAQRLGIAAALLCDPETLILDEPVNGLDTEGIRWIRKLMQDLAADGRTIFVASNVMAEIQQTADRLIVIGHGRLLADCTMDEFIAENWRTVTFIRSPALNRLRDFIERTDARVLAVDAWHRAARTHPAVLLTRGGLHRADQGRTDRASHPRRRTHTPRPPRPRGNTAGCSAGNRSAGTTDRAWSPT